MLTTQLRNPSVFRKKSLNNLVQLCQISHEELCRLHLTCNHQELSPDSEGDGGAWACVEEENNKFSQIMNCAVCMYVCHF